MNGVAFEMNTGKVSEDISLILISGHEYLSMNEI